MSKRSTVFGNLRIITQEWNMETRDMTPVFHLLFQLYLSVTFIFVFENSQSPFLFGPLSVNSGLQNTWIYGQRLPFRTAHYSFLEDTLRILKIHVVFLPPGKLKITTFNDCQLINYVCSLIDCFSALKILSNQFASFDLSETLSYVSIIKLGIISAYLAIKFFS